MKITGKKLLAAVILLLYIEWWIGTITYIANKNNVSNVSSLFSLKYNIKVYNKVYNKVDNKIKIAYN